MMPRSPPVSPHNPFRAGAANRTDALWQPTPNHPTAMRHANTNPSSRVSSPAPSLPYMPNSSPQPGDTYNHNNGEGIFNNVLGDQHFDTSTAYGDNYEGDYFAAPIQGGNVGGRGNNNAIYNGSMTADPPKRPGGGGNTKIRGLKAKEEYFQSEIDRLMDEMGLDEEQKLERKITELQLTFRSLRREADSRLQTRSHRPESAPPSTAGHARY